MDVVVTGATGFLGSEFARTLLTQPKNFGEVEKVYLLIRPRDHMSAAERFQRIISYWQKFTPISKDIRTRIVPVECDLERTRSVPEINSAQYFFHAAAATDFDLPLSISRRANVYATQRALAVARQMPHLKRFVHISSAFAAGKQTGLVAESARTWRFNNAYEQTKRESEDAVRHGDLPFTIVRPSIVIGDSRTGYVWRMRVLYSVLRIWLSGLVPRAPIDPAARVDVVPIDYVIAATLALAQESRASGETFHLCLGERSVSPVQILQFAVRSFGLEMPKLTPPWVAKFLAAKLIKPTVGYSLRQVLEAMQWHLPYLGMRGRVFDMSRSEAVLRDKGILCPNFEDYGSIIFEFCRRTNWGKTSLRSAEQNHV